MIGRLLPVLLFGASLLAGAGTSAADEVEDFYKGKTINVIVGYPPGGIFDACGRLYGRHASKHIPGRPSILVRNMPGAASLIAANAVYNLSPKDGTEVGVIGGTVAYGPLWNRDGVQFEATKLNWLGSMQKWVGIVLLRSGAPALTLDAMKKTEVKVGATGAGDVTVIYPRILNVLNGTKMTIVGGYVGSSDLNIAIERGEVDGRVGWCWECVKTEKPSWISEKKVTVAVQLAFQRHPELPDAPSLVDLARSEDDLKLMRLVFSGQEMAVPFVMPPGVPAARLAAMRKAFEDIMADPEFLAEAKQLNVDINKNTWQEMEKLVASAYATPAPIVERAAAIIAGK